MVAAVVFIIKCLWLIDSLRNVPLDMNLIINSPIVSKSLLPVVVVVTETLNNINIRFMPLVISLSEFSFIKTKWFFVHIISNATQTNPQSKPFVNCYVVCTCVYPVSCTHSIQVSPSQCVNVPLIKSYLAITWSVHNTWRDNIFIKSRPEPIRSLLCPMY